MSSSSTQQLSMPPPSFGRTRTVPHRRKHLTDNEPHAASESDSDSLARIALERRTQEHLADVTQERLQQPNKDQVTRVAEAHHLAAKAAAEVSDDGSAADAVADRARKRANPAPEPQAQPTSASSSSKRSRIDVPVQTEATAAVYATNVPMTVSGSYNLLKTQVQASLAKEAAASGVTVAGQIGRRTTEHASYLIREINRLGPIESRLPRIEEHFSNPLDDTFLRTIITAPAEAGPHLNPDTEATMRSVMVPSRRAHEEQMLRTPRSGELACAAGEKCHGRHIRCPGGGATLMAYYTETEWAKYQDDVRAGLTTARLPDISRRCLLCIRYNVNWHIVNLRAQNAALRHQTKLPVITTFYNLVDVEGEYRMEDCIVSSGEVFEGLLLPIVKPSLLGFEKVLDRETGTTYYRQLLPYPGSSAPAPRQQGQLPSF